MPVMSEIIDYFTAFISGYLVFVAGAAVISIMIWGLTRVIKAGQGSVGGDEDFQEWKSENEDYLDRHGL
jgi:hypothetical protein